MSSLVETAEEPGGIQGFAMTITRGSIVQNKQDKWYGVVRLVGANGRLSVKSIADDTPSSFYDEEDFVPAPEAGVPWFKLRTVHINGSDLFCWELPSGEMICESDAVWFFDGRAFITQISQLDPDSPSPVLR